MAGLAKSRSPKREEGSDSQSDSNSGQGLVANQDGGTKWL